MKRTNPDMLEELKKLDTLMTKRATTSFADSGVPFGQAGVLRYLDERKGQDTSNRQIEEHFGISNPAASGLVKRLVEKGFAESQVDQSDKRFRNVRITAAGLEVISRVYTKIDDLNSQMLEGFTEHEKEEIVRLLRKMYGNLS